MEFAAYVGRLSPVQSDVDFLNAVEPLAQHETSFTLVLTMDVKAFRRKDMASSGLLSKNKNFF
jgi:hypothetical protein